MSTSALIAFLMLSAAAASVSAQAEDNCFVRDDTNGTVCEVDQIPKSVCKDEDEIDSNTVCVKCGDLRPTFAADGGESILLWDQPVPVESAALTCKDDVCECDLTLTLKEEDNQMGTCRMDYNSTECSLTKHSGCNIEAGTHFHVGSLPLDCGKSQSDPAQCTTDKTGFIKFVTAECVPEKLGKKACIDCNLHLGLGRAQSCNFGQDSQTCTVATPDDLCAIDGNLVANVACLYGSCGDSGVNYNATCHKTAENIECKTNTPVKRQILSSSLECTLVDEKTCEACTLSITASAVRTQAAFVIYILPLLLISACTR